MNKTCSLLRGVLFLLAIPALGGACSSGISPQTAAAKLSGYTYVPVDPQSIETVPGSSCSKESTGQSGDFTALLDALPDRFDASGNVVYGVGKAETSVGRYRVTTDFINSDTVSVPLCFRRSVEGYSPAKGATHKFVDAPMGVESLDANIYLLGGDERYSVQRCDPDKDPPKDHSLYYIPVYVGVGLRVAATINVEQAGASISGLGALGAEAQAGRVSGDLVVQTLGVNGEGVTAALPIQSELNRTTVTNSVVAVASIKTLLRDQDTVKAARLVGLYLPFRSDQQLVNAIISALTAERVEWPRPCGDPKQKASPSPAGNDAPPGM
jgi:hypothetical protein